jgi:hydroxymethylglutaryl-CoA lyase
MIRIVETGPRDGLQNEPAPIPLGVKAGFVRALAEAGLREIEAGSFVSPRHVPQMADTGELWKLLPAGPRYLALVPNQKGLERALTAGVEHIALFTAASDAFCEKNIGMTVRDSLAAYAVLLREFRAARPAGRARAYVSTAFECPYDGKIEPAAVGAVAQSLHDMGCDEIAVADTIGVAVPREVRAVAEALKDHVPVSQVAWHFHDTHGTAIANVSQALSLGFGAFDSSAGGLGGCPFAPGAGGNLATEDLAYFCERNGLATGVELDLLAVATLPVLEHLGRRPAAKAQLARLARRG